MIQHAPVDDTFHFIQEVRPQIENEIMKKVLQIEQPKMQSELQAAIIELESLAEEEFLQAEEDLEKERQELKEEQEKILRQEIEKNRKENGEKEEDHDTHLKEKFISENYNDRIMSHERILALENQLMEEIFAQYEEKFSITKNRKMKEMLVKMENKQQKDRKQKDKSIKGKVYGSVGIEQLKKDIEILRVSVASMKSEYNVKIKKIQADVKAAKQKNKQLQLKQENLTQLKLQLSELKEEKERQIYSTSREEESKISYMQEFSLSRDQESLNGRYLQPPEDILMESEEENYQDQLEYESSEESQVENPPKYQPEFEEYATSKIELKNPILGLNIGALLREEWDIDPLQKYVSNSTKQNDSRVLNRNPSSNFQQQYHKELLKMNGKKKLGQESRNQIIRNLAINKKVF